MIVIGHLDVTSHLTVLFLGADKQMTVYGSFFGQRSVMTVVGLLRATD